MSQTLLTVSGHQFRVKNTFIDTSMCDTDAASADMRRCKSEPILQRTSCEVEVRSRSHTGSADCIQGGRIDWAFEKAPMAAPTTISSDFTGAESNSDSLSIDFQTRGACSRDDGILPVLLGRSSQPIAGQDCSKTTILAKNFPAAYNKLMVLNLLDVLGFECRYDFVYLPVDFGTQRSFGYAFINFVTHEDALDFKQSFINFSNWAVSSTKFGAAEWSGVLQGFEKHVERYRDSPMMHPSLPDHLQPSIFRNGEPIAFPPPTKALKMPRRVNRKPHNSDASTNPIRWCPMKTKATDPSGQRRFKR